MSQTRTTALVALDISSRSLVVQVTSATGFAVGQPVYLEQECVGFVVAINSTQIQISERGYNGTFPAAHDVLSTIVTGLPGDFGPPVPGRISPFEGRVQTKVYGASGAMATPVAAQSAYLTKAGVGAMTIVNPGKMDDGIRWRIIAGSAQAHTVTGPTNCFNNTTHIGTFGGAIGDGFDLEAFNSQWMVCYNKNVTLS